MIDGIRAGDAAAQAEVWTRFFDRLVGYLRGRMQSTSGRVSDEEDVALSVMQSVYNAAEAGRLDLLRNGEELWALLREMAHRKVIDQHRHQTREKRGGGNVRGESAVVDRHNPERGPGFDGLEGSDPTPEELAVVEDTINSMVVGLGDDLRRSVARLKLEGLTDHEIAERLDRSVSTVERALRLIRLQWKDQLAR